MAMTKTISGEVLEQIGDRGKIEVLVGIPTFNNVKTVEAVLTGVKDGVSKVCPQASVLVVNADAGSQDGTQAAMKQAVGPDTAIAFVQHLAGGFFPGPISCRHSPSQGCPAVSMHFVRSLRSRKSLR